MPRKRNSTQRREQIVDALKMVMAECGYEGASIQAIARRAELTPGLIHYHFGSKLEILGALVKRLAEDLEQRLAPVRESRPDDHPESRLNAMIDAWLALDTSAEAEDSTAADQARSAVACWVMIGAEAVRQPAIRALYRESISRSIAALQQALEDELSAQGRTLVDAPALAAGLMAAIEGYFQIASTAPELVPVGSAAQTVRSMARGLVLAQPLLSPGGEL